MTDVVKKQANKPAKPAEDSEMVKAALAALKERTGSTRQAIEKYIKANYKVGDNCGSHLKLALRRILEKPKRKVVKKPATKKALRKLTIHAIHAKRVTIMPKDIHLALGIRGEGA
jgi:histone H1/5